MPDSVFTELTKRIVASLDTGMQAVDPAFKAYAKYPYSPAQTPYALVYVGGRTLRVGQFGSESDDHLQTLSVLFVLGYVTEGQDGELAEKLYQTYLPALYDHFYLTKWLTSPSYLAYPEWLSPVEVRMAHGGWQRFANSGTGNDQLGVLFTLTLPMVLS